MNEEKKIWMFAKGTPYTVGESDFEYAFLVNDGADQFGRRHLDADGWYATTTKPKALNSLKRFLSNVHDCDFRDVHVYADDLVEAPPRREKTKVAKPEAEAKKEEQKESEYVQLDLFGGVYLL